MKWPWQKKAYDPFKGQKNPYHSNTPPIPWPALESFTGTQDVLHGIAPEDVVPEAVEEYIRGVEGLARRLRSAAETHYMRRREPGYRNRSWRRHRCTDLLKSIWEVPIEYAVGNPRGIAALISQEPGSLVRVPTYMIGVDPAMNLRNWKDQQR
jgi:hypothetical protein